MPKKSSSSCKKTRKANNAKTNTENPIEKAGVRSKLPKDVVERSLGKKAGKFASASGTDVLFVVDISGSMSGAISMVKKNMKAVAEALPEGSQLGVVVYSDVCDSFTYKVISDFTDNREELSRKVQSINLSGGGDTAEAQYSAFALASTMSWNDGGLIVHITDAPPHTKEAEASSRSSNRRKEKKAFEATPEFDMGYDFVSISTRLQEQNVSCCTFLISAGSSGSGQPYYIMAGAKTGGHLFYVTGHRDNAIRDQVFSLIKAVNASLTGQAVDPEFVDGMELVRCADDEHMARFVDAENEEAIRDILGHACKTVSVKDSDEIADAIMSSFGGMLRGDASLRGLKRAMKGMDYETYDRNLRSSAEALHRLIQVIMGPETAADKSTLLDTVLADHPKLLSIGKEFLGEGAARQCGKLASLNENLRKLCGAGDEDLEDNKVAPVAADDEKDPVDEIEDGPECIMSAVSLAEQLADLAKEADIGVKDDTLARLLVWFGSLVYGVPMNIPYNGEGKFNFQDAWVTPVEAVRHGHTVQLQTFLDYIGAIHGGWECKSLREMQRKKVDDLLLRADAQNTGVLPLSDGSRLNDLTLRALARTPWLGLLTWVSVCRDARPVPNAFAGTLSCCLLRVVSGAAKESRALTAVEAQTAKQIVHTLRLLEWPACGANQATLISMLLTGDVAAAKQTKRIITTFPALLSAQNDMSLPKIIALLAQLPAEVLARTAPGALRKFRLAILGECITSKLWLTKATFIDAIGNPNVDGISETAPTEFHPLERKDGALPEFKSTRTDDKTLVALLAEAVALERTLFATATGREDTEPLDQDEVAWAILLEALSAGKGGRAIRTATGEGDDEVVTITEAVKVPTSPKEAQPMLRDLVRKALIAKYAEELRELHFARERWVVTNVAIPAVLSKFADKKSLANALNASYTSPHGVTPDGVFLGPHNVPEILARIAETPKRKCFLTLVAGRTSPEQAPVCWGGRMCNNLVAVEKAIKRLYSGNKCTQVRDAVTDLRNAKNPASTAAVAGSKWFNKRMAKLFRECRRALGLGATLKPKEIWILSPETARQCQKKGVTHPSLNLAASQSIKFSGTSNGHIICCAIGPLERAWWGGSWSEALRRKHRTRHVRTFPKHYGIKFEQKWEIPEEEIQAAVERTWLRKNSGKCNFTPDECPSALA